jgi:hypothetical protein
MNSIVAFLEIIRRENSQEIVLTLAFCSFSHIFAKIDFQRPLIL